MPETTKPELLAYGLNDAGAAIGGASRTKVYDLIAAGKLDARKLGRRTVVTAESIRRYLESLPPADIRYVRGGQLAKPTTLAA